MGTVLDLTADFDSGIHSLNTMFEFSSTMNNPTMGFFKTSIRPTVSWQLSWIYFSVNNCKEIVKSVKCVIDFS